MTQVRPIPKSTAANTKNIELWTSLSFFLTKSSTVYPLWGKPTLGFNSHDRLSKRMDWEEEEHDNAGMGHWQETRSEKE